MRLREYFFAIFILLCAVASTAQSLFPPCVQRGATLTAEIKGYDGAYAVLFDCDSLTGEVVESEIEVEEDGKSVTKKQYSLKVDAAGETVPGAHAFRLVSPAGVSKLLWLQVSEEPTILQGTTPNNTPRDAQHVGFQIVVQGKLSDASSGVIDYYSFDVEEGRELLFEAGSGDGGFDPTLTLYEQSGSWFDEERLKRLAYGDETNVLRSTTPQLTYRFAKPGRYFVAVAAFVGVAPADAPYLLRITSTEDVTDSSEEDWFTLTSPHAANTEWDERNFDRVLDTERIQQIWTRTADAPKKMVIQAGGAAANSQGDAQPQTEEAAVDVEPSTTIDALSLASEVEPNQTHEEALEISIPVLIEGRIGFPADIDVFRFKVEAEQALAFEIETPETIPPNFNPRINVFDGEGGELMSNVFKHVENTIMINSLQAKTIYTFKTAGEYYLHVRDVTSREGDERFAYRILVRPQIPHVGRIEVMEDHFNLNPGGVSKLTANIAQEEGFGGDLAVTFENLPPGVQVLSAAEVDPDTGVPFEMIDKERFVPKGQKVNMIFLASEDAPGTPLPRMVRMEVRPISANKPGPPFLVKEFPIMVLRPENKDLAMQQLQTIATSDESSLE